MRNSSLAWAPPLYFLYYAAAAALVPFLVIYYQELGLKGTQIGFLAGIPPLLSLVSAPVWGAVVDKTGRHKFSLLIAMGGVIFCALALSNFETFAWLIPVVILFSFFSAPIMPIVDSTTMSLLGVQKDRYGKIRLWGAIGWGIAAPIVGMLIESGSISWSFWSYAGLMGLGLLVVLRMPAGERTGAMPQGGFRLFLGNPRWLIFLMVIFSGGVVLSMIGNFLFIFLDTLGANKFTLGLMLTMATLSELPVLFFSNRLLRRWNAKQLMGAALLFYAIRGLALSFVFTPALALFLQLLHGPTFSLMWIAGVSYADQIAPVGFETTAQGLFTGVLLGIGSTAGALLGGWLYEYVGLVSMFRLSGLISLVGLGFLFLMEKMKSEYSF